MQFSKIVPCLWFDGRASEALDYYLSVFPNSRLIEASRPRADRVLRWND